VIGRFVLVIFVSISRFQEAFFYDSASKNGVRREVFLKLMNYGREIGRTCLQLRATSPFMTAAVSPSAEIKVLELEKQHVE
jgi:hypothetical protein